MGRATNTEYDGKGIAHKWPVLPIVGTKISEMFRAVDFVKLYREIARPAPCKQLQDIQYILCPGGAPPPPQQVGLMASLPGARNFEDQTS